MENLFKTLTFSLLFGLFSEKTAAIDILGKANGCPGGYSRYYVHPIPGAAEYVWTASNGAMINWQSSPVTLGPPSGDSVLVSMPWVAATVQLTVTVTDSSGQVFTGAKTVLVQELLPTILPPVVICPGKPYQFCNYIWLNPTAGSSGVFDCLLFTAGGCDSIVQQPYNVKPPILTNLPPKFICPGECFDIGGQSFCESGQFSVTLDSYQGCDSTINFYLTVLDPKAKITGPTAFCGDSTIILTSPSSSNISKKWTDPAGNLLGTGPDLVVSQTGKYFLETKVVFGGKACAGFDSTEITVGSFHPDLSTALPDSLNCENYAVQILAQSATPGVVFVWVGDQNFTQIGPAASVFMPGNYVVTASLPDGCTSSDTVVVAYFDKKHTFSLLPNPSVVAMPAAASVSTIVGMEVKNQDTIDVEIDWEVAFSDITSGATFQVFDKSGVHQPTEMSGTFTLHQAESAPLKIWIKDGAATIGCGEVRLFLKNRCTLRDTATAIFKVDCTVGTEEILDGKNLRIFPNPTPDGAFFVENLTETGLFLKITMPDGRPVFSKKIAPGREKIAPPSLPGGAYFLFFENENGTFQHVEKLLLH